MEQRDKPTPKVNERKWLNLVYVGFLPCDCVNPLYPLCVIILLSRPDHPASERVQCRLEAFHRNHQPSGHAVIHKLQEWHSHFAGVAGKTVWWKERGEGGGVGAGCLSNHSPFFAACLGPTHPVLPPVPKDPVTAPLQDASHTQRAHQHPSHHGGDQEAQASFLDARPARSLHLLHRLLVPARGDTDTA